MNKAIHLFLIATLSVNLLYAQADKSNARDTADVFMRLTSAMKAFKPDTSAAPNDALTRGIVKLRALKGGFNINEAIDFKLEEDRQKGDMTSADGERLTHFFKSGHGRRWLDNAVIHIYREQFTLKEVRQLIQFYKKPAGQKLAGSFPLIMLQSLVAAETIKAGYTAQGGMK